MNNSRILILFIVVSFIFNGILVFSFDNTVRAGTTIVVAKSGGDYDNVGDAVNNSNDGDTIYIQSGTYYHFDWGSPIVVNKNITIHGQDADTTIIKTNFSTAGNGCNIFKINCTTFTMYELNISKPNGNDPDYFSMLLGEELESFTMYACNFFTNDGIRMSNLYKADCEIYHCDFVSSGTSGYGIYYWHDYAELGGNLTVRNTTFFNHAIGINILDNTDETMMDKVLVENCTFDPSSDGGFGVRVYRSNNVTIQNNILNDDYNSQLNGLCGVYESENIYIYDNIIYEGNGGMTVGTSSNATVLGNMINNCTYHGILIDGGYPFLNWVNVSDNIINNSERSIRLRDNLYNVTVNDNYIYNASDIALYVYTDDNYDNTTVYNNYFQGTDIYVGSGATNISFNISKTGGSNILGGVWLGGNYWWNYSGTDGDGDGIGDTNYSMNGSSFFDELPLTLDQPTLGPPTNIQGVVESATNLNISWTKNDSADTTLVRSKVGSYPSSVTDGTLEYNDTGTFYVDSWVVNTYYTLWSYNSSVNDYSIPAYLIIGSLTVNAYNESNTSESIVNYSITVSNDNGNAVEFYEDCTNSYVIDLSDFDGNGSYYFQIEHENYSSRTYYADIIITGTYILDAYLPPLSANLYYVKVINDYAQPINDAHIVITRSLGGTVREMSSGTTDYFGMYPVYLLAEKEYLINISATGYESIVNDRLFPDPDYYGYDYPIIYQLGTDYTWKNYTLFFTDVLFEADMISAGYMQLGNITVNYTDSNSSTVDTDTYIYELYNGTTTLVNVTSNASQTFSFRVGNYSTFINTSRDHVVVLWFNNTADFADVTSPVSIYLSALHIYRGDRTRFSFNDRITNLFGPFNVNGMNIGWHSVLSVIIGIIVLCLLGPYDTGLGILGAGLGLGLTHGFFELWFTDTFPVLLVTLVPFLVIIGVIYLWAKHQGVEGI